MRIESILQTLSTQFLQKKGLIKNTQPVNNNEDKVEISSKARELQKNQNTDNVQKSDPLKDEKLREIREKISDDYYSSKNVISKIADNLLKRLKI